MRVGYAPLSCSLLPPFFPSYSSLLPLFPVTPSSPTELSLALPYDRRVGVELGVYRRYVVSAWGGEERGKKLSHSSDHVQPPSLLSFPQGKKGSGSGFSTVELGAGDLSLHWNTQPTSSPTPLPPPTNPPDGLKNRWAACCDY